MIWTPFDNLIQESSRQTSTFKVGDSNQRQTRFRSWTLSFNLTDLAESMLVTEKSYSFVSFLCLPKQSWCYHTSFGHDQPPSLPGLHDWSSVTLKTRGEIISLQEGDNTWLPLSLIVKPAVPATILPSSEAPSLASSRIVTGTDIIPLWKFWGFSALIWENQ